MKSLPARINFAALLAGLTLYTQGTAFADYTISTLASTSSTATISGNGVAVDTAGRVYATEACRRPGPWQRGGRNDPLPMSSEWTSGSGDRFFNFRLSLAA